MISRWPPLPVSRPPSVEIHEQRVKKESRGLSFLLLTLLQKVSGPLSHKQRLISFFLSTRRFAQAIRCSLNRRHSFAWFLWSPHRFVAAIEKDGGTPGTKPS